MDSQDIESMEARQLELRESLAKYIQQCFPLESLDYIKQLIIKCDENYGEVLDIMLNKEFDFNPKEQIDFIFYEFEQQKKLEKKQLKIKQIVPPLNKLIQQYNNLCLQLLKRKRLSQEKRDELLAQQLQEQETSIAQQGQSSVNQDPLNANSFDDADEYEEEWEEENQDQQNNSSQGKQSQAKKNPQTSQKNASKQQKSSWTLSGALKQVKQKFNTLFATSPEHDQPPQKIVKEAENPGTNNNSGLDPIQIHIPQTQKESKNLTQTVEEYTFIHQE